MLYLKSKLFETEEFYVWANTSGWMRVMYSIYIIRNDAFIGLG